jgi:hypothetical protein
MTPNDSSHTWPELPDAGELVRLSLPLPPQLIDAAGNHGAARYVALFRTPDRDETVHWLLADRDARMLDVGAELDVRQFLATQPSELSAVSAVLSADRLRGLLLERSHRPPSAVQAHARLGRSRALVEELRTWLDHLLEATLEHEGGKR